MWKIVFFFLLAVGCSLLVFSLPPIPQDPHYHAFLNIRALWLTSLLLILLGLWGCLAARSLKKRGGRVLWKIFFLSVMLSGLGSAYYHLDPTNLRLAVERLPLAVGFTTFLAIVVYERISAPLGIGLTPVLIGCGLTSVWLWIFGTGDLRLYALVQFFPLIALPIFVLISPTQWKKDGLLLCAWALYILAKVFEMHEGHLLKHLTVAVAVLFLICYVRYGQKKSFIPR